jgi:2-polyprenyl-3-methyl-5-hydroxy-6-metoxy-1,4-benzoquinol methylase
MIRLLFCFVLLVVPAFSQAYEESEKRIANLKPAEQAFERFRFWRTQNTVQGAPWEPYKKYLLEKGYSSADADAQIKMVQAQGNRAEVDRWNRILTSEHPTFNTNPNEFLVQMAKDRKKGTALDVGMGQGRNAIWLAQQGWEVTGFDPAEKAVALAQELAGKAGVRIRTEIKGMEDFDFGERRWDLILMSYVGARGVVEKIQHGLKPGGILVVEGFHKDATKGASIGGGVVFDTGELPKLFPELRTVRYEEPFTRGDFGNQNAKVRVVRYCGERPE